MKIEDLKKQYDAYLPSVFKYTTLPLDLEELTENMESDIEDNIKKGFSTTQAAVLATTLAFQMAPMNHSLVEAALNIVGKKYHFEKPYRDIMEHASFRCLAVALGFPILMPAAKDDCKDPFPADALPAPIRNYVKAVTASFQVPIEMAGSMALGVMSAAVLKKYIVREHNDHLNPLCLYIAVCAASGERKSSTLAAFTEVLKKYENQYNHDHFEEIEKTLLAVRRFKHFEDLSVKNADYTDKCTQAKKDLDSMDKVYPLRLSVDDTTPEALTNILETCGERAAVIAAEGGFFDVVAGCYNNKTSRFDVLLHAHDAEQHSVDRVCRPTITLEHPELAIVVAVQPDVIRKMMTNGAFEGRGLLARFLYSICSTRIGTRHYLADPIPAGVKESYDAAILKLLEIPVPDYPAILELSSDATCYLADYFEINEKYLAGNPIVNFDGSAKHVGTIVRIAGLLHVVDDPMATKPISKNEMARAIDIAEYFREQAEPLFSGESIATQRTDGTYVLNVIRKKGFAVVSKRDLHSAVRGRIPTVNWLDSVLDDLAARGYLRIVEDKPSGKGRPSSTIIVNPMVLFDQNES